MKRTNSPPITAEMASYIKRLLAAGLYQHQIASAFKINQGRVSEINTGKRFANTCAARQLPFNFG
jgi:predicted XRE-type DNA-binding protein